MVPDDCDVRGVFSSFAAPVRVAAAWVSPWRKRPRVEAPLTPNLPRAHRGEPPPAGCLRCKCGRDQRHPHTNSSRDRRDDRSSGTFGGPRDRVCVGSRKCIGTWVVPWVRERKEVVRASGRKCCCPCSLRSCCYRCCRRSCCGSRRHCGREPISVLGPTVPSAVTPVVPRVWRG